MGRLNISKQDMSNKLFTIVEMLTIINAQPNPDTKKDLLKHIIEQIKTEAELLITLPQTATKH